MYKTAAGLSHAYNRRGLLRVPSLSRGLFNWFCPSFFLLGALSRVAMESHAVASGMKDQEE